MRGRAWGVTAVWCVMWGVIAVAYGLWTLIPNVITSAAFGYWLGGQDWAVK